MIRLSLPTMSCPGCVSIVKAAIRSLDPEARIEASAEDRRIAVETGADEARVRTALVEAGYASTPIG
ncbi:copper chaperone CopZ [Brevundimonas sp. UYEF29]|uniref:heavy-metal-associated domain-containing protein n=1 Tax=Brevundimonas TaxID=41275 RepID=UPI002598F06F|nr:heavy-metal-associated domain-containing protein [uncultured Brevundimonas sp.]